MQPRQARCALTGMVLTDPVMLPTLQVVVERGEIEKIIAETGMCPFTNSPLNVEDLIELPQQQALLEKARRSHQVAATAAVGIRPPDSSSGVVSAPSSSADGKEDPLHVVVAVPGGPGAANPALVPPPSYPPYSPNAELNSLASGHAAPARSSVPSHSASAPGAVAVLASSSSSSSSAASNSSSSPVAPKAAPSHLALPSNATAAMREAHQARLAAAHEEKQERPGIPFGLRRLLISLLETEIDRYVKKNPSDKVLRAIKNTPTTVFRQFIETLREAAVNHGGYISPHEIAKLHPILGKKAPEVAEDVSNMHTIIEHYLSILPFLTGMAYDKYERVTQAIGRDLLPIWAASLVKRKIPLPQNNRDLRVIANYLNSLNKGMGKLVAAQYPLDARRFHALVKLYVVKFGSRLEANDPRDIDAETKEEKAFVELNLGDITNCIIGFEDADITEDICFKRLIHFAGEPGNLIDAYQESILTLKKYPALYNRENLQFLLNDFSNLTLLVTALIGLHEHSVEINDRVRNLLRTLAADDVQWVTLRIFHELPKSQQPLEGNQFLEFVTLLERLHKANIFNSVRPRIVGKTIAAASSEIESWLPAAPSQSSASSSSSSIASSSASSSSSASGSAVGTSASSSVSPVAPAIEEDKAAEEKDAIPKISLAHREALIAYIESVYIKGQRYVISMRNSGQPNEFLSVLDEMGSDAAIEHGSLMPSVVDRLRENIDKMIGRLDSSYDRFEFRKIKYYLTILPFIPKELLTVKILILAGRREKGLLEILAEELALAKIALPETSVGLSHLGTHIQKIIECRRLIIVAFEQTRNSFNLKTHHYLWLIKFFALNPSPEILQRQDFYERLMEFIAKVKGYEIDDGICQSFLNARDLAQWQPPFMRCKPLAAALAPVPSSATVSSSPSGSAVGTSASSSVSAAAHAIEEDKAEVAKNGFPPISLRHQHALTLFLRPYYAKYKDAHEEFWRIVASINTVAHYGHLNLETIAKLKQFIDKTQSPDFPLPFDQRGHFLSIRYYLAILPFIPEALVYTQVPKLHFNAITMPQDAGLLEILADVFVQFKIPLPGTPRELRLLSEHIKLIMECMRSVNADVVEYDALQNRNDLIIKFFTLDPPLQLLPVEGGRLDVVSSFIEAAQHLKNSGINLDACYKHIMQYQLSLGPDTEAYSGDDVRLDLSLLITGFVKLGERNFYAAPKNLELLNHHLGHVEYWNDLGKLAKTDVVFHDPLLALLKAHGPQCIGQLIALRKQQQQITEDVCTHLMAQLEARSPSARAASPSSSRLFSESFLPADPSQSSASSSFSSATSSSASSSSSACASSSSSGLFSSSLLPSLPVPVPPAAAAVPVAKIEIRLE